MGRKSSECEKAYLFAKQFCINKRWNIKDLTPHQILEIRKNWLHIFT